MASEGNHIFGAVMNLISDILNLRSWSKSGTPMAVAAIPVAPARFLNASDTFVKHTLT